MKFEIEKFVSSAKFQNFILVLIIINGITMGIETSKNLPNFIINFLHLFDKIVIGIFTVEILLRIYVHRLSFFKDSWSLFDFFIVVISLIPANENFAILRILRVLRLLRLITIIPQMRKIVSALISVIPGMLSISALMGLIFYIFSIMATNLYGDKFPQWFGSLGDSFYTLFQIMTLESWSMGIVRPVMEVFPYAWLFFIPFIFIATFIMINLVVAVIVDAMSIIKSNENSTVIKEVKNSEEEIHEEIKQLKKQLEEIKLLLEKKV